MQTTPFLDRIKKKLEQRRSFFFSERLKDTFRPNHAVFKFEDVQNLLDSGDLILSHGRERFSRAIQACRFNYSIFQLQTNLVTGSYWSHAAILIRNPSELIKEKYQVKKIFDHAKEEKLDLDPAMDNIFVFESETETFDKRPGGGCQVL
jgi:hypothetical protein